MLLSFLLKVKEDTDRSLSLLDSYYGETDFARWWRINGPAFMYVVSAIIVIAAIVVIIVCLNKEKVDKKIDESKEKREKKREERIAENEREKQHLEELAHCYITLVYCYDDKIETIRHKKGKVFNPNFPSREGYSFDGWYINTARTIPFNNEAVDEDISLYAKWIKEAD